MLTKTLLTVAIVTGSTNIDIQRTEFKDLHECFVAQDIVESGMEFFGYKLVDGYEFPFVRYHQYENKDLDTVVSVKCKTTSYDKRNSSWTTTTNAAQQTDPATAEQPVVGAAWYQRLLSALLPSS